MAPETAAHGGKNTGWLTQFITIPARAEGLVVLTNSDSSGPIGFSQDWADSLGVGSPETSRIIAADLDPYYWAMGAIAGVLGLVALAIASPAPRPRSGSPDVGVAEREPPAARGLGRPLRRHPHRGHPFSRMVGAADPSDAEQHRPTPDHADHRSTFRHGPGRGRRGPHRARPVPAPADPTPVVSAAGHRETVEA